VALALVSLIAALRAQMRTGAVRGGAGRAAPRGADSVVCQEHATRGYDKRKWAQAAGIY